MAKQKEILDRMRNYSSLFSGKLFSEFLKYDDYTFFDNVISKYDSTKVGKDINTYKDYICYTYRELRKEYRSEYLYKNVFINDLLLKKYRIKDTVAISEFRVGNSIADIALFNGGSKAFEIKTELDSKDRLKGQLADYKKIFQECYIITHESLVEKYLQEDETVGVISLVERPRSLVMEEVRPAVVNNNIDRDTLIRSVRSSEYLNIVRKSFGELPEMNSFNMFDICREMLEHISYDELNVLFVEEIKKRKSNIKNIKGFQTELRQLCLGMNISDKDYEVLTGMLNKEIVL